MRNWIPVVVLGLGVLAGWAVVRQVASGDSVVAAVQPGPLQDAPQAASAAAPAADRTMPRPALAPTEPIAVDPAAADLLRDLEWNGRVVDHHDEPLAGARVWVVPNGSTLAALGHEPPTYQQFIGLGIERPHALDYVDIADLPGTTTGRDGTYNLSAAHLSMDVTPGRRCVGLPIEQIAIAAPGFATRVKPIEVGPEESVEVGTLALEPEAVLVGRVTDEDGRPLADALVRLENLRPAPIYVSDSDSPYKFIRMRALLPGLHSARTNVDGAFRIPGLWPGQAEVGVLADGCVRQSLDVELASGETTDLGTVQLARGGRIEGRVTGSGAPLEDLEVFAVTREVRSGGAGCVITMFAPGNDTLPIELDASTDPDTVRTRTDATGRFVLSGLPDANFTLYAHGKGWETVRVRNVGIGRRDLQLDLAPAATLRVAVVAAATGEPVRVTDLLAWRVTGVSEENPPLEVRPDGPDAFLVPDVGPLGTRLVVVADGFAAHGVDAPGVPVSTTGSFVVELEPEARISGSVVDAFSRPVTGVAVNLFSPIQTYKPLLSERTDSDGRFALTGLPAGAYELKLAADGHVPEARSVLLDAGLHLAVDLALQGAGTLQGQVRDARGEPRRRAVVTLTARGGGSDAEPRKLHADDEGVFTFAGLAPGGYVLSHDPVSMPVEVTASETTDVVLTVAAPAVVLGRVWSGDQPVAGAIVYSDGRYFHNVTTDEEGRFRLVLRGVGEAPLAVEPPGGRDISGPTLTVGWGDVIEQDLHVGTGRIEGRVVDDDTGEPVPDEPICLYIGDDYLATSRSDDDGSFAFAYLAPDDYRLWLDRSRSREWLHLASAKAELTDADPEHDVVIQLSRGATLEGDVRLPNGVPAPDGTHVRVWKVGSQHERTSATAGGRYRLSALPPGDYRVTAFAGEFAPPPEGAGMMVRLAARETLTQTIPCKAQP